jgi:ubiquinone/menaquinone biosynthesis C-methylase UbiE
MINNQGQTLTHGEQESIKQQVSASYDDWADGALPFWNWGLFDQKAHHEIEQQLGEYDRHGSDGYSEQLYYFTLRQVPQTKGTPRKILEVGSGAGAGLNFLARNEPESTFVGVDLARLAVARANARFSRPNVLSYLHGDAEKLPFGDNEFDVVINVESSHNYPSLTRFFGEVGRVLKPGGYFSHVDFFTDERKVEIERCKADPSHGLRWLSERDISELVKAAIRKRMEPQSTFRTQVRRSAPPLTRFLAEPSAMIQYGSTFIQHTTLLERALPASALSNGGRVVSRINAYRHLLAQKPA